MLCCILCLLAENSSWLGCGSFFDLRSLYSNWCFVILDSLFGSCTGSSRRLEQYIIRFLIGKVRVALRPEAFLFTYLCCTWNTITHLREPFSINIAICSQRKSKCFDCFDLDAYLLSILFLVLKKCAYLGNMVWLRWRSGATSESLIRLVSQIVCFLGFIFIWS